MESSAEPLLVAPLGASNAHSSAQCQKHGLAVRDALDVLQGKWRLPILATVRDQELRFGDFLRALPKLTPKVLADELRYLEMNELIMRKEERGHPPRVTYTMTEYGHTLGKVILALSEWGTLHRKRMMGDSSEKHSQLTQ